MKRVFAKASIVGIVIATAGAARAGIIDTETGEVCVPTFDDPYKCSQYGAEGPPAAEPSPKSFCDAMQSCSESEIESYIAMQLANMFVPGCSYTVDVTNDCQGSDSISVTFGGGDSCAYTVNGVKVKLSGGVVKLSGAFHMTTLTYSTGQASNLMCIRVADVKASNFGVLNGPIKNGIENSIEPYHDDLCFPLPPCATP